MLEFFIFYISCNRYGRRHDDNYDVAGSSPLSEGSDQGLSSREQMENTFGKVIPLSSDSLKLTLFSEYHCVDCIKKSWDMGYDLEN